MKKTFGQLKSSIINKLVNLYENENKSELKNLLKEIKSNDDFKELYLFYENIENIQLNDDATAKLYVENMEPFLIEKIKKVKPMLETMSEKLSDVNVQNNEIYECIDILSENTTLLNLEKKVIAKNKLIQYIKTKKEKELEEEPSNIFTENTKLLSAVLTNNFNSNFQKLMSEEEKQEFKKIASLNNEQIINEIDSIKNELLNKLDSLLNESKDSELIEKLNNTKEQVINSSPTKYNYYKLTQLKNGLD